MDAEKGPLKDICNLIKNTFLLREMCWQFAKPPGVRWHKCSSRPEVSWACLTLAHSLKDHMTYISMFHNYILIVLQELSTDVYLLMFLSSFQYLLFNIDWFVSFTRVRSKSCKTCLSVYRFCRICCVFWWKMWISLCSIKGTGKSSEKWKWIREPRKILNRERECDYRLQADQILRKESIVFNIPRIIKRMKLQV